MIRRYPSAIYYTELVRTRNTGVYKIDPSTKRAFWRWFKFYLLLDHALDLEKLAMMAYYVFNYEKPQPRRRRSYLRFTMWILCFLYTFRRCMIQRPRRIAIFGAFTRSLFYSRPCRCWLHGHSRSFTSILFQRYQSRLTTFWLNSLYGSRSSENGHISCTEASSTSNKKERSWRCNQALHFQRTDTRP
jgi:hypothetical protein